MSPDFNPPPNWPPPPAGWTPPPGWQPDPAWGPPPPGWQLWSTPKPQRLSRAERNRVTNRRNLKVAVPVLGGIILICGVAAIIGGGGDDPAPPTAAATQAAPSTSEAPPATSSTTSAPPSTTTTTTTGTGTGTEAVVTEEDLAAAMDTWWFEQGGYYVPVAASALDTYVTAVGQGDALAAANACLALDEAVGGIFNPVGLSSIFEPIPDEGLQETLSIARSKADDAAEGCQDGLSDGDAIALSESLTDAAEAYAGLSAVYDGVFTTYVEPALGR